MSTIKKILFLYQTVERKKLFGIMFLVLMLGFVEMLGVAIILPFLAIVAKPSIVYTNVYLSYLFQKLSFTDPQTFLLFLGSCVFLVLVCGNAFSALTFWISMRTCYFQGKKISHKILYNYLSQPYVYFLNKNTSELINKIIMEVDKVVIGVFINGIQILSKSIMVTFILALLFIVEPKLAFTVLMVLGSAYVAVYYFIRKKLAQAGRTASQSSTLRINTLNEVFGAIKELKILGKENTFLESFDENAKKYAQAETLSQLSPVIVRYLIEAIAFGGMILIILYLISTKQDLFQFMPLLGLYAISGYRLMPAMQQLFAGFSSLKYYLNALNVVYNELQIPTALPLNTNTQKISFKHSVELSNIEYAYPNSEQPVVNNISLKFPAHTITGIVGASGGGKTTLIDIILGLLKPQNGVITVDDCEINNQNVSSWQKNIGYVPQHIFLLDASITANIALGEPLEAIDMGAVLQAAKLANLHEFITNELPLGYKTVVGERGIRLSGGQRQRIGIARALYHNPELLIFDEATSALDNLTEKVIMEAIRNLGSSKTIILIAHRLNTVKDCNTIYVINKGKLIGAGTYQELMLTNSEFQHLANAH